jgi:predicted phosphodiesterase
LEQNLRRNKIILIGDCHGQFEKLDAVLTSEEPFDFFVSVGDVGSLSDVTPQNINIIDKWKEKGYFVRGNHDDVQFFNPLELSSTVRGIHVSGLNGIVRSRTFANDTKDISFREIMYLSHQKNVDILVTHQAPTGVFNGMGESVLEELLNYLVPKIYVFGHVHQYKLKFHLQTFMISLPMIDKGHAVAYFQGNDLRNLEVVLKKGKKTIRV